MKLKPNNNKKAVFTKPSSRGNITCVSALKTLPATTRKHLEVNGKVRRLQKLRPQQSLFVPVSCAHLVWLFSIDNKP